MITQRDHLIERFLEDFKIASTKQLKEIFFCDVTMRRCRQRLKKLVEYNKIKRFRSFIVQDYLYYYYKKPTEQIEHMLMRVDAFIKLNRDYTLNKFKTEFIYGSIRADAYFEVWNNGQIIGYFLEIQRHNYFNQKKYERVYNSGIWTDIWDEFPIVVVVARHRLHFKSSSIKYIRINQNSPKIALEPF